MRKDLVIDLGSFRTWLASFLPSPNVERSDCMPHMCRSEGNL